MAHPAAPTGVRRAWSAVRLDFAGVAFATLFFCLSLTPSLLPRDWMFQGVICGINATIGYGLGVVVGKLGHRFVLRNRHWWPPSRRVLYLSKTVLVAVSVTASLLMLIPAAAWQRQVSALMGMTGPTTLGYLRTLIVAVLVAAALIAVSRLLLEVIRTLANWQIRRWNVNDEIAFFIGTAVVVVLLITLINGVLPRGFVAGASRVFQPQNASTRTGVEQPMLPERSGSPESLAPWDSLGYQGRNFVGTGPDAAELTALNGRPAKEPIRIYAGLATADTTEGRLDVLLSEMQRLRVQDRQLLVIIPTTGTGWVDPVAARAIESMYNGDTALVAMQYSYLPSWISFIADQQTSMDAGRAMVHAIHERWSQWPTDQRPDLVLYGESLGSMAGQAAFEYLPDIVQMEFSAVLWVGPPNASPLWRAVTARRDPGTPQVAPRYDNGRTVRFSEAESPAQVVADTAAPWDGTRVLFLQHPSDPVVWWSSDLLFERPDWLVEPPGYDRTASMRWYPIVTFWQVGFDIINASAMPAGHGHNYSRTQLDGWVAVAAPDGWTAADTERIRRSMEQAMAAETPEFA
ncbi:alpha/beta-hydrolase family protein [Mycolicibacterium thermoresistibile]